MNITRIALLSCLTFIVSCTGTKLEPVVYNDSLVMQQIKIVEKANELQDAFAGYVKAEMEIRQKDFVSQLDRSDAVSKRLGAYGDDKRLLKATEEFIEGYRKLNRQEYQEAIHLLSQPDSTYSEADEARISMLYKAIDDKIKKLGQQFIDAQQAFAKEHQLELNESAKAE
jgi:hypothetical protein